MVHMQFPLAAILSGTWLGIAAGFSLLRTPSQDPALAPAPGPAGPMIDFSSIPPAPSPGPSPFPGPAGLMPQQSCDVDLSGPICFAQAGRQQNLLPKAVPDFLVAHYDFDGDLATDLSGNGHHVATVLDHGPSPVGSGHSALFTKTFMEVLPSPQLNSLSDFTYSFWVYLAADDTPAPASTSSTWCPLIRKGISMPETQQFANAPALLFNQKTGKLRAEVTTDMNNIQDGEYIDSNARLLPNRWLHLALVHHSAKGGSAPAPAAMLQQQSSQGAAPAGAAGGSSLLLYVNGILDTATALKGGLARNEYPLYVGGDPFTQAKCGFTLYIDELRVYNHAVPPHQLQAEAAPALGGTDPSYVRLGCMSCTLAKAAKSCPASRHICESLELHTGGYQVARSLGWLTSGTHVWTHKEVTAGAKAAAAGLLQVDAKPGLGLCCEGPPQ